MNEQTVKNYSLNEGTTDAVFIAYKDDDFESARFGSGNTLQSETALESDIEKRIDQTISKLADLQKIRKDFQKIKASHASNRSDTERRMVG